LLALPYPFKRWPCPFSHIGVGAWGPWPGGAPQRLARRRAFVLAGVGASRELLV